MRLVSTVLLVLSLGACKSETPSVDQPVDVPKKQELKTKKAPAEPQASALCIAKPMEAEAKEIQLGGKMWTKKGTTLSLKAGAKAAKAELKVGLVADIKEASDENLSNLKKLSAWFVAQKVDAVVILGDSGESEKDIVDAVGVLAKSGLPTFNMMGNREGTTVYQAAMATLGKTHTNVMDLNEIRRIDFPQAELISLPGYFNPNYIHAEDGCRYGQSDLQQTSALIEKADSPVVLLSHGGPLQTGAEALDLTHEKAHVGDAALSKLLLEKKILFGAFANVHEAGGRGTDLEGKIRLKEKKYHPSLFVNPGPADGVIWQMNDGKKSMGMGAILSIKDGNASYRLKRLNAAELAKAQ